MALVYTSARSTLENVLTLTHLRAARTTPSSISRGDALECLAELFQPSATSLATPRTPARSHIRIRTRIYLVSLRMKMLPCRRRRRYRCCFRESANFANESRALTCRVFRELLPLQLLRPRPKALSFLIILCNCLLAFTHHLLAHYH